MRIEVEYTDEGLFGSDPAATVGVDTGASRELFEEMVKTQLIEDFPLAEVTVEQGDRDRHLIDGQEDHAEEPTVHNIIDQVWQSWQWIVYEAIESITLTTAHSASSYGKPVLLVNGQAYGPSDTLQGRTAAEVVLEWAQRFAGNREDA